MNKLKKCDIQDHNGYPIISLCIEDKCKGPRLLCQFCIQQHRKTKHEITTLKTDIKQASIRNLCIHYKENNQNLTSYAEIDFQFQNMLNKCQKIIDTMQKFKDKCFINHLFSMRKIIVGSFQQDGYLVAINKIMEGKISEQQLNTIIQGIRCFDKEHLKSLPLLKICVKFMTEQLSRTLDSSLDLINASINEIEKSINQWSILKVQDYLQKINIFVNQISKKEYQSLERLKREQIKQLQIQKKELIKIAKQKGWNPITEWVQPRWFSRAKSSKLQQLMQLSLIGNNIPKVWSDTKPTINQNITKIQRIQVLTNLKQLKLKCNNIKEIQNLNKLQKLQVLILSANNIKKIQNLSTLTLLKTLALTYNKIEKIENLEALHNLAGLFLDHNNISIIQNLQNLVNLKQLNITYNPIIKCIENEEQSRKLMLRVQKLCWIQNYR